MALSLRAMQTVRIFISSPGDVEEEREKSRQVIGQLQRFYGDRARLVPVLWEDLPLGADIPFQEGIDVVLSEKHQVDIAVFVIWARLGSPVGGVLRKPDGSNYRSGTEREFDLMLAAREQSGGTSPHILAYMRQDDSGFNHRLDVGLGEDALSELVEQRRLAREFIDSNFQDEEGRNVRAFYTYPKPLRFGNLLHTHLKALLDELLGEASAATWHERPYRGLEVFDVEHAAIFQGRDEGVGEVEERLRARRSDADGDGLACVVIVGASGAGKSSLARAGVAARLTRFNLDENVREWRHAVLLPGAADGNLTQALLQIVADAVPEMLEGGVSFEDLAAELAENPASAVRLSLAPAMVRAAERAGGTVRLLLIVDQMEELWTDRRIGETDREEFLELLVALARAGDFAVLGTLRSDFYAQAQGSPAFMQLKGDGGGAGGASGHFDLMPPDTAGIQRMITEPARLAGLSFEHDEVAGRRLDQQILHDATRDPGALPLLQYALAELYEQRRESDGTLTFAAYDAMGGVEGALGRRAEECFSALTEPTRAALPALLPQLVSIDTGGEQKAVRRRALVDEVGTDGETGRLCAALVEARLLTSDRDRDGRATVSLAHEALLSRWPRLHEWIDDNRDLLRMRSLVEQGQRRWEEGDKDDSLLLASGLPLEEGRRLVAEAPGLLAAETAEYIRASIEFREAELRRRTRRRQLVTVALGMLAAAALAAGGWAWKKQGEAETQLAETQRQLERSQLEEGKAWLERARLAKEKKDHLTAIMLAGRAVGFEGYGRESASEEFRQKYPLLLGGPLDADPLVELERREVVDEVADLISSSRPVVLPVWMSPASRHHFDCVSSVSWSPDGARIASASLDRTIKLWDADTGKLTGALAGHISAVTCVSWSPDGRRIASVSDDKTVKLWDAASGKVLATLEGHTASVRGVSWSADARRIASASSDKTVKLWDAASGEVMATLKGHTDSVGDVSWNPDGNRIASASHDKTVKVWDAASGEVLATLEGHTDWVEGVSWSPDGKRISSASHDKSVKLWDAASGEVLATLEGHTDSVRGVSWSADGRRIASASSDKTVKLWDAASGEPRGTLIGHTASVVSVAWSPDSMRIASSSGDNTLKLWDASGDEPRWTPEGHTDDVNSVAWSPCGLWIASASHDKTVKLWDGASGELQATLKGHALGIWSVDWSPDGKRIASGSVDAAIKLWNAVSGEVLATLNGHTSAITSVSWSPDGRRIASASYDKTVKLWDAASGEALVTLEGHTDSVVSVSWSPDGRRIASASASGDKTIKLWDTASGELLATLKGHSNGVESVSWSPDGRRIASASTDRTIKLWDASSGESVVSMEASTDWYRSVAWSPDGKWIASSSDDATLRLWDAGSGKLIAILKGHTDSIRSVSWSPDGRRLASASSDTMVKLWDVGSGEPLTMLDGHFGFVTSVSWSPDGTRLASGSGTHLGTSSPKDEDTTVKLWDVEVGELLAKLEGHAATVTSVAWNPAGTSIATASGDRTIRVWDASRGQLLAKLEGHVDTVTSVSWSPDGTRIASASGARSHEVLNDATVRLWDAISGEALVTMEGHSEGVTSVAWSPDSRRIASAAHDKSVKLWDSVSGELQATVAGNTDTVHSVAWSPDGTRIACGSADAAVTLMDAASGEVMFTLNGHNDSVLSVAWSPDGRRIASASGSEFDFVLSKDTTVRLWDATSGEALASMAGHSKAVTSVSWSPDGTRIASASNDSMIKLWNTTRRVPNLGHLFDQDMMLLQGRRIYWPSVGQTLFESLTFGTMHYRDDELSRLSASGVGQRERLHLRMKLCAQGNVDGQVPAACATNLWNNIVEANAESPETRRIFLLLLGSTIRTNLQNSPDHSENWRAEAALQDLVAALVPESLTAPVTGLLLHDLAPRILANKNPALAEERETFHDWLKQNADEEWWRIHAQWVERAQADEE